MTGLLVIIQVISCIALIMIVLLQTGRGADIGAAFGGASQTLFGSAGPATFMNKLTTVVAVVFMLTTLSLSYISSHGTVASVVKPGKPAAEQKARETATTPAVPAPPQAPGAEEGAK